jgi:putative redox protein
MDAEIISVKGLTFIGKSDSRHWAVFDAPEEIDGQNGASRPMEMVLIAMGGCTGMDLGSLFKKMQVDYDRLEIKIHAERATEHPKIFTEIKLKYLITGKKADEEKIKKAIDLSMEKYCSVTAILRKSAKVSYEYEILPK